MDRKGYPGSKTKPDHALMQRLFESGSFCWTGYYFAPTRSAVRKTATWMGKRALLAEQGWGIAPIYWGFQQNDTPVKSWTVKVAKQEAALDVQDAVQLAYDEGFEDRTVIYLDVESTGIATTKAYVAYVQEWVHLLSNTQPVVSGTGAAPQYFPGVYVGVQVISSGKFGQAVGNAERWLCGGTPPVGGPLDSLGLPMTPNPSDAGEPAQMWQYAMDATVTANVGYQFTDYQGTKHLLPGALDYDTSSVPDPSGQDRGQINEVIAVAMHLYGGSLLGGTEDAQVRVILDRPAARPLGVDVVVTDGTRTQSAHVAPRATEVICPVPTDAVDQLTMVTYSARTAWWAFARAHREAVAAGTVEPAAHFTTATVRPPAVISFTIPPKVKVKERVRGEIVLDGVPTMNYRVLLFNEDKVNGNYLLEDVPAEISFTSDRASFYFKGAYGTSGGLTAQILARFPAGSRPATTAVYDK
jgi:hypothetical protein